MKILNAHAQAIEAELAESFQMIERGDARIDFDADFGVGRKSEMLASEAEEIFDLRGREIRGSAAAPMELGDRALASNGAADAPGFALQDIEIGRGDALVFLDDDVAGAEEAEALAKGNVHVKRDGRFGAIGLLVDLFEIIWTEGIVPDGRGRVARVARTGAVVASEKLFADAKLIAHVFERWVQESQERVLWVTEVCDDARCDCWPVSMKSRAFSTGVC